MNGRYGRLMVLRLRRIWATVVIGVKKTALVTTLGAVQRKIPSAEDLGNEPLTGRKAIFTPYFFESLCGTVSETFGYAPLSMYALFDPSGEY